MKIDNIHWKIPHIFWTTWGISVVILEVTKNQVFTLLLENTFFEKPQRVVREGSGQIDPQSCFEVRLP